MLSISLYRWDLTSYDEERYCDTYNFTLDEIDANITSEFTLDKEIEIHRGDWLKAKSIPDGKTLYFGFVDSRDKLVIRCRGILGLADSSIPTRNISGQNFEMHALKLIDMYLLTDRTKHLNKLDVQVESNTPHTYQATEISTRKLNSYLINAFKKYNVKWYFKRITKDMIYTAIKTNTKKIRFNDTTSELFAWDVFFKKVNSGTENKLIVVDKALSNMESPNILATYYLGTDGITTNPFDTTIECPTVTKTYLLDRTQADIPSYDSIATSELSGNAYSHEISFYIPFDTQNFDLKEIETGVYAEIYYKGVVYQSVITALNYSSQYDAIKITCGNIRSRAQDNFD